MCPKCRCEWDHSRLLIAGIQQFVASYYNIDPREMVSNRRSREVTHPRQVAMFLSREFTPKSLPDIGRRFGNRDHTTVMHALRAVAERASRDVAVRNDIEALREALAA